MNKDIKIIGLDIAEDRLPKLVVMCGLQGSGKSTIAEELSLKYNMIVLSSDKLRKEFPDENNEFIFRRLYNQANIALKQGLNVILDATNITIKSRKQIFLNIKEPCKKICYIVNTPYEVCIERVKKRNEDINSHQVPLEVVRRYLESFEVPFYEEGWDNILLYNIIGHNESVENFNNMMKSAFGFDQHNKHHTQLLHEHLESVANQLYDIDNVLYEAGLLHDIGKLDTQTYKENDPNAHYYNHANVGAYKVLCNYMSWYMIEQLGEDYPKYDTTLDIVFYINYHMHMYNIKTEKSERKWRQVFGDIKFNNLKLLNEADQFNHSKEIK